jgi:hypothetical protein
LNAPVFWKFSHLKNKEAPAIESNAEQVQTGVRCARPANRFAAARTSSNPGKVNSSATPFGYPANIPLATPRKTTADFLDGAGWAAKFLVRH